MMVMIIVMVTFPLIRYEYYGFFVLQPDIQACPDSLTLTLSVLKWLSSLDPEQTSFVPTSIPLLLQYFQPGGPYPRYPFSSYITSLPQLFFRFYSGPSRCSLLDRLSLLYSTMQFMEPVQ